MSTPVDKIVDELNDITLIFSDPLKTPKQPAIKTRTLKSSVNRLTQSEDLIERLKEDVAKLKYEVKGP